jgi:hypothetical protein
MALKQLGTWDTQTATWDEMTSNYDSTVSVTTKNYSLAKPVVGGSENEWGGILNRDIDAIDALLGGDAPVRGINIETGTINASAIVGSIDGVVIGSGAEINGSIGSLSGGSIADTAISAVTFICEEAPKDTQYRVIANSSVAIEGRKGGLQLLESVSDTQNVNFVMTKGQNVTLVVKVGTGQTPAFNWSAQNAQMFWSGGDPELSEGYNLIHLVCVELSVGPAVIGSLK